MKKLNDGDDAAKALIFRTTRALRDKLVRKAAQDVLDGHRIGLGAGATYSVNHAATQLIANALGIEFEREDAILDTSSNRVGMSFLFPPDIYEALKAKAERDGISINEELQRILELATSTYSS